METIQSTGRTVFLLGWVTLGLMLLSGVVGGLVGMATSRNAGWGSVFFLFGALQTLLYAVPVGVLLYIGFTLPVGMVIFVRNRWGNSRSAPRS